MDIQFVNIIAAFFTGAMGLSVLVLGFSMGRKFLRKAGLEARERADFFGPDGAMMGVREDEYQNWKATKHMREPGVKKSF